MSVVIDFLSRLTCLQTSAMIFISYLLFYTMYDKLRGTLVPTNLIRILTLRDGLDKTLVEFNKAVSLSGLSVLCFSFFPIYSRSVQNELLWSAMVQLWIHFVYSAIKYYGTNNIPYVTSFLDFRSNRPKKVSIIAGLIAQLVLSLGYFSYITLQQLATLGITLGLLHFYAMEVDYKFVLRVRPFAYIVFPLAALGLLYGTGYM